MQDEQTTQLKMTVLDFLTFCNFIINTIWRFCGFDQALHWWLGGTRSPDIGRPTCDSAGMVYVGGYNCSFWVIIFMFPIPQPVLIPQVYLALVHNHRTIFCHQSIYRATSSVQPNISYFYLLSAGPMKDRTKQIKIVTGLFLSVFINNKIQFIINRRHAPFLLTNLLM